MTPPPPARHPRLACALLLALLLAAPGCAIPAVIADALVGERTVKFDALYDDLQGRDVAVFVAADQYMLYDYPASQQVITYMLSARIDDNVEETRVLDPERVIEWKDANPFWLSRPIGSVFDEFDVDRLVVVDLTTYRTHEAGNRHQLQGVVAGRVEVYENNDDGDLDNPDFVADVRVEFPENVGMGLGVVGENPEQIEQGMVNLFSRDAARLFHEYEKRISRR